MNLPTLIKHLYGTVAFTGLHSFEFVDRDRTTITEIFFMMPPKSKSTSEGTRSSTSPTLSGNYNNDAGNSTKQVNLSGSLYFPIIGSPDNPIAPDPSQLENTIDGMNEFFKMRWMLVRYRDYTMTRKARMTVPTDVMSFSPEIDVLYSKVAGKVSRKIGALYDEIQLIYHDYDMDDHFYCRVDKFTGSQSDDKLFALNYTISLELTEPDNRQAGSQVSAVRAPVNQEIDSINSNLQNIDFSESFTAVQTDIQYNSDFISEAVSVEDTIEYINTENENIQAGKETPSTNLPLYATDILASVATLQSLFTSTFLSAAQQALYATGDLTLDDVLSADMVSFYNTLQKVEIQTKLIVGILASIVQQDEVRYYSDADDYKLTTDQFDTGDESKVASDITFYYYTVMDGDTSRLVAQRELGDSELFVSILKLNNILDNDFIEGTLVGTKIKIPLQFGTITRSDDNLVYESDQTDIEKFLYGTDIATGINNELLVSSTGDVLETVGVDNAFDNIETRIENNKGSLNVFSPDWGTIAIDESNAPLLVKINRYLTDLVNQIQSDPRVESVKMDMSKLEWDGEKLSTSSKVYFIGTEETREVNI